MGTLLFIAIKLIAFALLGVTALFVLWILVSQASTAHLAAIFGRTEWLGRLLAANPKLLRVKSLDKSTPLHGAVYGGHLETAALLLSLGAELESKNDAGYTPLHLASHKGHAPIAALLLAKGADVNAKTSSGDTPIFRAIEGGYREVVELLLSKGADPALSNKVGFTPLHEAASEGRAEILKLLLDHNAELKAKDNAGATPLEIAQLYGRKEIMEILRSRGASYSLPQGENRAHWDLRHALGWFFGSSLLAAGLIATANCVADLPEIFLSRNWPAIPGNVVKTEVLSRSSAGGAGRDRSSVTVYRTQVLYSYQRGERRFTSDRLAFQGFFWGPRFLEERLARNFPLNAVVLVRHPPGHPERGIVVSWNIEAWAGLALAAVGYLLLRWTRGYVPWPATIDWLMPGLCLVFMVGSVIIKAWQLWRTLG